MTMGMRTSVFGVATVMLVAATLAGCNQGDVDTAAEPRGPSSASEAAQLKEAKPFACAARLSDESVRQGSTVSPPPTPDEPPLPGPDRAWVCQYQLDFSDPNERPHNTWLPTGPAVQANGDGLTRLTRLLATMRLQPESNPGGPCPANLGPIWLLVVEHEGERSGLTYADFGCGTLQLTEGERLVSYESAVSLHEVGGLPETLSYVFDTGVATS